MTRKQIRYRLEAAALLSLIGLFRLLGLDRASAFSGWVARRIGPRLGVTRRARRNLARAMPELSTPEIERIVADMWENLGRTVSEYAHLDTFARADQAHRLELVGDEIMTRLHDEGRAAMFVSGHFANWELMPLAITRAGYAGGEVYRHANNPFVNEWILALRRRAIMPTQIPKGPAGAKEILKVLKRKQFIAMLVDQKMNDGLEADFFGLKAMTTSAPASLAVRYGAAIVPACIERVAGAHFRQTFHQPIEVDKSADPFDEIARITQALNDFIEARIRARPHEWLWLHNRWPDG